MCLWGGGQEAGEEGRSCGEQAAAVTNSGELQQMLVPCLVLKSKTSTLFPMLNEGGKPWSWIQVNIV